MVVPLTVPVVLLGLFLLVCCEEEVFCFDAFELLRHALCVVGEVDVVGLNLTFDGYSSF